MKKGKIALAEASPFPPSVGEDFVARMKHQISWQDYEDLLKDTEAKRLRLQKAKEIRLRLLAEVRFLRKKHHQFMQDSPQGTPYRLKKQQPRRAGGSPARHTIMPAPSLKDNTPEGVAKPKPSVVLDLNQAFTPSSEEEMELPFGSETFRMEKLKRCSLDMAGIDMKIATDRAAAAAAKRVGKRKVSWQDQVALKV